MSRACWSSFSAVYEHLKLVNMCCTVATAIGCPTSASFFAILPAAASQISFLPLDSLFANFTIGLEGLTVVDGNGISRLNNAASSTGSKGAIWAGKASGETR